MKDCYNKVTWQQTTHRLLHSIPCKSDGLIGSRRAVVAVKGRLDVVPDEGLNLVSIDKAEDASDQLSNEHKQY